MYRILNDSFKRSFSYLVMNIEIVYLGGLWVMIKLGSAKTKLKFMKHTGVASWFVRLCNAQNDFVASDRIVWVDIEGVPLHAWSHATFHKIGSQWGEVMELEDGNEDLFARKRLCIKTKHANNILDSFKIIVKGKVFQIRAKELFVWSPSFKEVPEVVHCSDDESVKNEADINVVDNTVNNEGEESDSEAVSDTFFGDNGDAQEHDNEVDQTLNDKEVSKDPFNIYDLLNRHKKEVGNSGMESSIPYPPGFTPEKVNVTFEQEAQEVQGEECIRSHHNSDRCSSRVFEEVEKSDINIQSDGRVIRDIRKEGGSILDILDEMIKVGQTMGFTMDGCTKDMEKIIGSNGETKKESFSDLEVKYFWGNYQFDHIVSEALGYSGGILCVWDSNVFHKKHHIISDNFVALYGTWIPRKIQLLIISVYAPQSYASKCQLWDFIASLINQWNGECMVMGDFNEVRCKEDRWGSTFLAQGACSFNSFISNAGLNEVQLEGSCRERTPLDHRPILLREMLVNFGATPFRLYHSWLSIPGFDQMITSTWNTLFFGFDSNGMIRFKKKLQLLKKEIRKWVAEYKNIQSNSIRDVKNKLSDIDKLLDQGGVMMDVLLSSPDGFTFEFFRKFWTVVGPDFCIAVKWFFEHGFFATGCNSSFVTLIPKTLDPKLMAVWIQGSLNSGKASVLVNGSPTSEFQFHRGLKQGDPLAPFLFILIMESLHLSFNRAVEAGMSINLKKSHILGLGIRGSIVSEAAASLGCSVMKTPFNYLGIMVYYFKVKELLIFPIARLGLVLGCTLVWKDLWIVDCHFIRANEWQWRDLNGTFSVFFVAKAWEALRPSGNQVSWFRNVWFSLAIPRHVFHLWTALSVFGKLILAASSYYIWLERNNRLFKKGKRSPEEIRDIIIVTVRLKLTTFRFKKTAMGPKGERLSLVWLFSWKNWKMFDSVDMKTYESAYRLRLGNFRYVVPAIEKARLYRVFFSKLVSGYVKSDISHKRIQIYSQDYGYILRVVDDPLD
ncbi:RNA-directed DNA polymerase, eukaryota [Tanacetum coccineum]